MTSPTRRLIPDSRSGVIASSQWRVRRWYSMAPSGATFSIRKGITMSPFRIAASTSLSTSFELLALAENTTTAIRLPEIALMMAWAQMSPGLMSRPAIQQRAPFDSSALTIAFASLASSVE